MSYIGVQPTAGQYRKLDDISASFNGSTTSFTTSVGGTNVTAGTAQQLLVSVGGVIQEPDADYTVSTNTITFTTAPASGLDFFAVLMGDALNTVTTSDGSITTAKLAGSLSVGLAAGTNSAPSLYFTGDSNTGVYSPGADQVAVATGGTARLTIDSSGNVNVDSNTLYVDAANNRVGLGTSSPGGLFHISSTFGTTLTTGLRVDGLGTTTNNVAPIAFYTQSSNWGTIHAANIACGNSSGTNGGGYLRFSTSPDGNTAPVERIRVTEGGLVGIGSQTPGSYDAGADDLVVANSGNGGITVVTGTSSTGSIYFADGTTGNEAYRGRIEYNHSNDSLNFGSNGLSPRATIDSSGRLLVGTSSTSKQTRVLVQGNSGGGQTAEIIFAADSSSPGGGLGNIYFSDNSHNTAATIAAVRDGGTWTSGSSHPVSLQFYTTANGASSPTERVRIANNGNFYIGGGTSFGASGWTTQNAGCQVSQYSPTSDTRTLYQWQSDNAGTNTTAVYIESTGKIYARTTTVQAIASERRLKENIAPVDQTESWSTVRDLPYYSYNFIGSDPINVVYGPIADEVPDEMRVATNQSDDVGVIHTYDNAMLQARSFVALQAALKRIETLEAEVAALKGA